MPNPGVLAAIGSTPLVRLLRLPPSGSAEVWIKLEMLNPTGSMKDRMALSMVEGAEQRGILRPGDVIVEYTGGSTGASLAMVSAAKGYHAHLVYSDAFSEEKLRAMRALGAFVEVISSESGKITPELTKAMEERVAELAKGRGTYWTNQFGNPDNRCAYHAMAEEILAATAEKLDAFVMGVGTGGCFSGNAEVLKERVKGVMCVAVEPAASRHLSGGPPGGHIIEGIGPGKIHSIMRMELVDRIEAVTDEDAQQTTRELARQEGIFAGISSGANVAAALRVAKDLGAGRRVVTVAVDSGLKYLSEDLYQ